MKFGEKWKFEKKFENLEIVKKIWEFGEKCGNLEKKSETLEENVEVLENFRIRKNFWEIWGKFGNEGENWKNLGIN